jgi:hypothetical protein
VGDEISVYEEGADWPIVSVVSEIRVQGDVTTIECVETDDTRKQRVRQSRIADREYEKECRRFEKEEQKRQRKRAYDKHF